MSNIQYLSQFNLLHSLSKDDLVVMDELTSITIYPKHTFIQTPQTFTERLYFVKKGRVRLYRLNTEGKQFTLDILGEGNVFGELNGLSLGTREVFIETLVECDICMIDQRRFENFLIEHPQFMLNMMKVLSDRLVHMSSLAQNLALGKLHEKILHVIVNLSNQFDLEGSGEYYRIDLPLTHQEVANLVGATREAVTLVLKELSEAKGIKTGFRTIYIHRDYAMTRLS